VTHEDAGHYAAKHSKDTELNPKIAEAVRLKASDERISCAAAHKIAGDLNVEPIDVGTAIDLLEYRITRCQIGLFGYGPEKKIVRPDADVSPDLERAIRESMRDGRISCLSCWRIAKRLHMTKMGVSAACEALGIKLCDCQLGAF